MTSVKCRTGAMSPAVGLILGVALMPRAGWAEAPVVDRLWTALTGGTPEFSLRWRYEQVDDDIQVNGLPLEQAEASTVRATLGYRTGDFHGFGAYLEFEAIGALGIDDYHDGSGTGNSEFATIADPEGVEVNQGYLSYRPEPRITLKAGRQIYTHRDAPFHRYLGTVLWRQNWQTQDAVTAAVVPLENLIVDYGYIWNVNRIFGEDAPEPLSNFESDSHIVNVKYLGLPWLHLEAYAYLLDFDNAPRFSSNTLGLRGNGTYPLSEFWSVLYTAEYAHQYDAAENTFDYSEDYLLFEAGFSRKLPRYIKSIMAKFSYEKLGGSGRRNGAFVTILGTNHAFQGWADRFIVTPNSGVEDYYVTGVAQLAWDMKFIISYHDLNSDAGSFDYGTELDLELTKSFMQHYVVGTKAAFYDADPGPRNTAGPPSADATIVWVWAEMKF
ncbi:MAG: hypothetical protein WD928_10345 [Gammaproteobacteria bacterium]